MQVNLLYNTKEYYMFNHILYYTCKKCNIDTIKYPICNRCCNGYNKKYNEYITKIILNENIIY
jgi:hypothetical protein